MALYHAIQDLIDSGLVNLSRSSMTTNPLLTILHIQLPLLLRLISMLIILMVIWYFGIFRVEDLVQSTWVHHFAVVYLRALFILIMVIIRVISILSSQFLVHQSYFCFVESSLVQIHCL